jgi:hypothetical protein
MERETEPASEQEVNITQEFITEEETARGIETAGKSPTATRKAEQENLTFLAFQALKRMDEKKNPQKLRSKKKRRAAAKVARRSRKQNG